ncbi:uncharacterized protein LOC126576593 [Anopheles aquasalis]|uniref:uncharacterized protein LOC126576593 n=1 Tax=Anopheles aquasalis TaxID=42839 RepID=UPI00215AE666|nr:uncharacterized protein LOC126576593 [Anopheles aquasalis]
MARDSQIFGATIIVIVLNVFVTYIASIKHSTTSDNDRWRVKDTQTAGSNLWSPASDYYDDRDRNTGGIKKDFISSYEDKHLNNNQLGNKLRLGYSPFSSGSYYATGGSYDRRPFYGPINYGSHDYESPYPYEYGHQANGYAFNYLTSENDLTRSVLLPLAGAALLGIAAALVANPVLLHLGVTAGKRKRRDVVSSTNAHDLVYRARAKHISQ